MNKKLSDREPQKKTRFSYGLSLTFLLITFVIKCRLQLLVKPSFQSLEQFSTTQTISSPYLILEPFWFSYENCKSCRFLLHNLTKLWSIYSFFSAYHFIIASLTKIFIHLSKQTALKEQNLSKSWRKRMPA